MTTRLVLASASPARLRTLRMAGIEPEVLVSGVDESVVETSDAAELSGALARLKAEAVASRLAAGPAADRRAAAPGDGPRTLVLGCDSVLAFDGEVLGKPADADEAVKRWRRMRGRSGVLHTGHCLIDLADGRRAESVATTVVHFVEISDAEIDAYVATGEPLHVAGAFTIDGRGGAFVKRIEGDHGNVIGLSLPLLRTLLARLDIPITDLWR